MVALDELLREMESIADPKKAAILSRFFKTGKGQYGEGDIFLGIKVPQQRALSRKFRGLERDGISKLLMSDVHEHRLVGILILIEQYRKASDSLKEDIFRFYIGNAKRINNWDLVDVSAPNIPGDFLLDKDKGVLYMMARSDDLWERRIAIMATFGFIRKKRFDDALKISEILLHDRHDLIHKAVGWMLREIGNRDRDAERNFLDAHYQHMPRTMLRYAIEKFDDQERRKYLGKR